jgi:putative SOS response-associated peptidase YedK
MKWGLVPHYSKFEDKNLNTTNARAENLAGDGGMWASLKGPKRCAVVCQGYYEWLTKGKSKLPHFVKPKDGRLMLMAGLFDSVVLQGLFIFVFLLPNIPKLSFVDL